MVSTLVRFFTTRESYALTNHEVIYIYNIADGIVDQIRREKRTTISEVIVAFHPRTRLELLLMPSLLSFVFLFFCLV